MTARRVTSLTMVLHANQYLITTRYRGRQGLDEIVDGYRRVLAMHVRHGIPASLHLSGTLIEALAWYRPEFLVLVRDLAERGVIDLVGGTYAENPMPCFGPDFNRRQLEEWWKLALRHLGLRGGEVATAWIPERIWDTAALAPVLVDAGYRQVLLDDRHLLEPDRRLEFDRNLAAEVGAGRLSDPELYRPHRIRDGRGLVAVPISSHLRYWLPPTEPSQVRRLCRAAGELPADALLTFADDLERVAGVGGWDPAGPGRYEAALRTLAEDAALRPVLLSHWSGAAPPAADRLVAPGTYSELSAQWGAGDDYRGWWDSSAWAPHRANLEAAEHAIHGGELQGAEPTLMALAWKHLLASSYESGWHDPDPAGGPRRTPAAWARALASQARSSIVIVAAATWFADISQCSPASSAGCWDVDGDGEVEVVLATPDWFAVLSPRHGGRLVSLFVMEGGRGRQVIGNPSDDSNLQEELNRYMDFPANHPGALVDVGFEHDAHRVESLSSCPPCVELLNVEPLSPLRGTRKRVRIEGTEGLAVAYQLAPGERHLTVEIAAIPDYLAALGEGVGTAGLDRAAEMIVPAAGCSSGPVDRRPAGHAVCVSVEAFAPAFAFWIRALSMDSALERAARSEEVA